MSDLISRDEAVRALGGAHFKNYGTAIMVIQSLPSAEPERNTGRWIFDHYVWKCSSCGKNPTYGMGYGQRKEELFNYCPYCGAKMEAYEK